MPVGQRCKRRQKQMAPNQNDMELECGQIEDRYWTIGRLVCLGYTSSKLEEEMHDPLNLSQVRHEQRRVAALLNSSGALDVHPFTQQHRVPPDQLYKNQYHKTFQKDGHGASLNAGNWDNSARTPDTKERDDYGRKPQPKKTLQETAYEHFDRLNFPKKPSEIDRRNQIAGKKAPVQQKYDVDPKRKNSTSRPLGGALQSKEDDKLRDVLRISSGDVSRNAPYRLPRKAQITRNLEVAIARSRRNRKNVDGRNLKPLAIPTGQSASERKSTPVARLKLKHDDIGKGLDLGKRISEAESARLSPLMISPLKTPIHDRVDVKSESSGRGVSAQTSLCGDEDATAASRASSSLSSGIGTYRADDEATKESEAPKDDGLSRQTTEDTLWFQRHGHTKSAWLRKRMREEAEKRRKDAAAADANKNDTRAGKGLNDIRKARQRLTSDVYKHANMDAYRQAYIKALAVARGRGLPKEPWMLGTRTSRAFTFSYFTHVPTCMCGQCPQKPREPKPKQNEMKMIFGDVKMMDYYKSPAIVKSKRRFGRKSREVYATAMNSLNEEDEGDTKGAPIKLPPIGNHSNNSEESLSQQGENEERTENDDEYSGCDEQNDKLSDSLLSDDENGDRGALKDTKRVSFKKHDGETSGYDSDSSTEM